VGSEMVLGVYINILKKLTSSSFSHHKEFFYTKAGQFSIDISDTFPS
jgi:hypothetical protein